MRKPLRYYLKRLFNEEGYQRIRGLYRALYSSLNDGLCSISVDISGMCNLNCTMCSFQKCFGDKGLMPLETYKKLENSLRRLNAVSLQCNCEPLLNKDIIKIIKFTKGVNKNIRISFVTNGTVLNATLISQLLSAGVNEIDVSIDGATKETYEKIRRGAIFEEIINNVKELVAQRDSSNNELEQININTVASKLNLHELLAILDLARTLGVDGLNVIGLDAYSEGMMNNVLYAKSLENIDSTQIEIFSNLREKAFKYDIELTLPSLEEVPFLSCDLRECVVSWNGNVSPCPLLSYERPYWYSGKKLIRPMITFGNINNLNLRDIWNSKEYRAFRYDLYKGRLPGYCQGCLKLKRVLCT